MEALESIGNTPLVYLDGIYIKLECSNPGGSIKDRIAKFMLEQAAASGELQPNDTVVEATSGNTGIALAMVARAMGYRAMIWMPEHMSSERRKLMLALRADVCLTPREEGFEGPIQRRDSFRDRPGFYVPDQFGNPENVRCHRQTTGHELIEQLADAGCTKLDAFIAGVGTGGTLMGVGEALREVMPGVKIVALEPEESAVMSGGCAGEHGIQGIGDGFIPDLIDMDAVDEVACVSTKEAEDEAHRIHDEHGFCVGISSGANMVAARRFHERGMTVATVWADCSDRYISLGLEGPSHKCSCPLKTTCNTRLESLLSDAWESGDLAERIAEGRHKAQIFAGPAPAAEEKSGGADGS